MGKLANASIIVILLFVLGAGASLPTVSADVLYYYKGPGMSPDQRFWLTDFRVEGPSNPMVGDTLIVSFNLTCEIPTTTLGFKGIFAAVRDADNSNRDFGAMRAGESLKEGDVILFSSTLVVDEQGLWKIWPSYQVNMTGLPISYGPDYWHSANITIAPALRPDLVVLDIVADPSNSRVGFTVANTGNATAPSSFSVRLLVGQQAFFETVPQGLAPGSQHSSWFYGYTWPENTNITATVIADFYNAVAESNEGNNALTGYLARQAEALRITQGPTAIVVDQDTVIIQWLTNLNSNSSVSYGTSKLPDRSQGNSTSTKSHCVALDKLSAGTTYSFFVTSWDSIGQKATSKQFTFETPPPSDGKAPSLYIPPWTGNLSGIVDVLPQASDEGGVDRLLFYFDGTLKFMDYSPPFSWRLNTTECPDGTHNLTVVAIDRFGNRVSRSVDSTIDNPEGDSRPPVVSIISPVQGEVVWGSVRIEALALDVGLYGEETGYIREAQLLIDGVLTRTWVYTPFRYNPITGETETYAPSSSMELLHFWDASMLAAGSNHTVEVRAWDDSGNMGSSIHNIRITTMEAYAPSLGLYILDLEYSRTVVRHGNWFEVTVSIRNTGTVPLYDFMIMEFCAGFQIISLPMPSTSLDNVYYRDFAHDSFIGFEGMAGNLTSGEVWEITYFAVPILYEPGEGFTEAMYQIGYEATLVCNGWRVNEVYENPYTPALRDEDANGVNDLEDAFRAADYLIVTNPTRLDDFNPADGGGVDLLLQDAATLAKAKSGVLGYLTTVGSPSDLRALIVPGGAWASRLAYCFQNPFASNAYLLLVGETEIVPAYTYNVTDLEIWWNGGGHTVACRLSDNYYADTCWDNGRPDIVVGRIIGDNARDLIKPIEASLQVHLGLTPPRDKALGVSGYEDGEWDVFLNDALAFEEQMSSHGFASDSIHWSILVERAWTVHFDDDDIFILGDVDGDALDEVVIARDEDDRIYLYEVNPRGLIRSFPATITPNDGMTAGDYDGDGQDEIAVAVNGEPGGGVLYIYEPNGTLIGFWPVSFGDSYYIDSGDIWENAGTSDTRDEVVIGDPVEDMAHVYELYFDTWTDELVLRESNFDLVIDLTRYDGFSVGDFTSDWARDEVAIIRDDDEHIYVYNIHDFISSIGTVVPNHIGFYDKDHHNAVKYTPYDGFAAGDVNGDGLDDMVVLSDNDDKTYVYYRNTLEGEWKWYSMYSQYWDYWFQGVRYNGDPSRHDGFGIGAFESGEPALMAVLLNNFGDTSSFQLFAASWPEADEWANERLAPATTDVSLLMIHGHGNPDGPSPTGAPWKDYWDFTNAPIVFAWSCLTGYYEGGDDFRFGDALLSSGALAFVGSTEVSAISVNHEATNEFYWDNWDIGSEYLGAALKDYKRVVFGGGNYWKLFVYQYNYYGDPKVVR